MYTRNQLLNSPNHPFLPSLFILCLETLTFPSVLISDPGNWQKPKPSLESSRLHMVASRMEGDPAKSPAKGFYRVERQTCPFKRQSLSQREKTIFPMKGSQSIFQTLICNLQEVLYNGNSMPSIKNKCNHQMINSKSSPSKKK